MGAEGGPKVKKFGVYYKKQQCEIYYFAQGNNSKCHAKQNQAEKRENVGKNALSLKIKTGAGSKVLKNKGTKQGFFY